MTSLKARRWRTAGYVVPLVVVIGAALLWSSYATYHHAEGPTVPGTVAWTMFVALDGAVIVTTPVMLSTVLSVRIRRFAGVICAGALSWSMVINQAETGWIGVAPPLIAGALIHLVGLVLRDFRRIDNEADAPPQIETADAPKRVEHTLPSVVSEAVGPVTPVVPVQPSPTVDKPVDMQKPRKVASVLISSLPSGLPAQEVVFWLLNEAHAHDWPEPKGPELTAAVREAGHSVNDEYGRTTKARWRKAREEVRIA